MKLFLKKYFETSKESEKYPKPSFKHSLKYWLRQKSGFSLTLIIYCVKPANNF